MPTSPSSFQKSGCERNPVHLLFVLLIILFLYMCCCCFIVCCTCAYMCYGLFRLFCWCSCLCICCLCFACLEEPGAPSRSERFRIVTNTRCYYYYIINNSIIIVIGNGREIISYITMFEIMFSNSIINSMSNSFRAHSPGLSTFWANSNLSKRTERIWRKQKRLQNNDCLTKKKTQKKSYING